jgi:hypothetical protein
MALNPAQVVVKYELNLDQVNLILAALGKLPFEQVDQLVNGFRSVALNALREAEIANDAAEVNQESEVTE